MALTAAFIGMGLTAAEAAALAGGITAAGTTAAAAAPAVGGAAGALGAGAGAGAAGMGAGGIGLLGGESAIPVMAPALAPSALPIGPAMGAGVEGGTGAIHSALPIGPMMGEGVEAFPQGPVNSAAQPSVFDKFFSGAKSMGSNMLDSATPKSTTDYLKLGQMGSQMATPSPMRPSAPPPMMRPGGSAIPLGDPQRLQSLTVGAGGGGGGLDPRTLAMLAKLLGGQR